jgi:hypothetical protein
MTRTTAIIAAALVALTGLTACGELNHDAQLAYERAKSLDICEWHTTGASDAAIEGLRIGIRIGDPRFRDMTNKDIEDGIRAALSEC